MAVLATVQDYLDEARVILQDTLAPYRYPDVDLVRELNMALAEMRRLRPDIFLPLAFDPPFMSAGALTASVSIDVQFRPTLIYGMVGRIELRDGEGEKEARAAAFLQKFAGQLLTATG